MFRHAADSTTINYDDDSDDAPNIVSHSPLRSLSLFMVVFSKVRWCGVTTKGLDWVMLITWLHPVGAKLLNSGCTPRVGMYVKITGKCRRIGARHYHLEGILWGILRISPGMAVLVCVSASWALYWIRRVLIVTKVHGEKMFVNHEYNWKWLTQIFFSVSLWWKSDYQKKERRRAIESNDASDKTIFRKVFELTRPRASGHIRNRLTLLLLLLCSRKCCQSEWKTTSVFAPTQDLHKLSCNNHKS